MESIVRHPSFDFVGGANDIMILRLRYEVMQLLSCNVIFYAFLQALGLFPLHLLASALLNAFIGFPNGFPRIFKCTCIHQIIYCKIPMWRSTFISLHLSACPHHQLRPALSLLVKKWVIININLHSPKLMNFQSIPKDSLLRMILHALGEDKFSKQGFGCIPPHFGERPYFSLLLP